MGRGRDWIITTQPSLGMYACQRWRLKFSEDSYIGHKNKTSRPVGSYKRSKSAAALPSGERSNGVDQDGAGSGGAGGAFSDRKTLKPSWNSDWTLQSHDEPPTPPPPSSSSSSVNLSKDDLTRASSKHPASSSPSSASSSSSTTHNQQLAQPPGDLPFSSTDAPPTRPARPSVSSRKELTDPSIPSSSSVSNPTASPQASQYKAPVNNPISYHVPPDSSTAAGTPVFTAKPFVISQTRRMGVDNNNASPNNANNNSPRRAPPPVPNSPPFDPTHDSPLARTQGSNLSHNSNNTHSQLHLPHHQSPSSLSSSPYISQSSSSSLPTSSSLPSSSSSSAPSPHRQWQSPDSTPSSLSHKSSYIYPVSSHASNFSSTNIPTSNNINISINSLQPTLDQPPTLPPPREQHHLANHRRENEAIKQTSYFSSSSSSFNSLPTSSDNTEISMLHRHKSEASGLNASSPLKGDNSQSSSGHTRQPSQEELECDLKAKQLAEELGEKDSKLSEVLSSDTNKKRMRYMDGLFSEGGVAQNGQESACPPGFSNSSRSVGSSGGVSQRDSFGSPKQDEDNSDIGKRASLPKEYWLSAPKAQIEMTLRHTQEAGNDLTRDIKDGHSLVQQKEELLKKLRKKLEVLGEDKVQLTQEIEDNNTLGKQVDSTLASKFSGNPSVVEKYKAYVEDQDKIVRLLLNLSGQLARAENAVEAIHADSRLKKLTIDKKERLRAKHEEAKVLKADIDKRKDQVSVLVQEGLIESEWQKYISFINKRPQLTIELQELEDKIKLGTEQMDELKKSIPNSSLLME